MKKGVGDGGDEGCGEGAVACCVIEFIVILLIIANGLVCTIRHAV